MATAVGVRVSSLAPRRSKVRFAPTSFYACGTKRRHPPAPLLLLSNRDPLRWARGWIRPTGGSFSFLERSVFIAPSTSGQSPLCSDVFLCLRHKKTSSARSLAPPLQPRPTALGSQLGPPYGRLFFLLGKICSGVFFSRNKNAVRLRPNVSCESYNRRLPGKNGPCNANGLLEEIFQLAIKRFFFHMLPVVFLRLPAAHRLVKSLRLYGGMTGEVQPLRALIFGPICREGK